MLFYFFELDVKLRIETYDCQMKLEIFDFVDVSLKLSKYNFWTINHDLFKLFDVNDIMLNIVRWIVKIMWLSNNDNIVQKHFEINTVILSVVFQFYVRDFFIAVIDFIKTQFEFEFKLAIDQNVF